METRSTKKILAIEGLLEVRENAIEKFGAQVDIIIVNPLSAYAEEGVLSQRSQSEPALWAG